jgi:TRAP-type transport system small permease protein
VGTLRFVVRNFEELLAGSLMVLMSLATVANVFARYFFNAPFEWAEEFARYTFIWLVFVGAVVATKQKKHIIIDAVTIVAPVGARRVMAVIADILTMVLMLLLIYYGWRLMSFTIQPTATLRIPQYWIYLSVPFSATLIILHSLADMRRNIAALINGSDRP